MMRRGKSPMAEKSKSPFPGQLKHIERSKCEWDCGEFARASWGYPIVTVVSSRVASTTVDICTDDRWFAPTTVDTHRCTLDLDAMRSKCCGRRVSRTLRSIIDTASVICFKSCFKSWFPTKSFLPFYVLRRNEMRFHENMLWSVKQCVNCNQIDNIFLWLARSCILYRPLSIIKRCLSFTLILPDVYYSLTV